MLVKGHVASGSSNLEVALRIGHSLGPGFKSLVCFRGKISVPSIYLHLGHKTLDLPQNVRLLRLQVVKQI